MPTLSLEIGESVQLSIKGTLSDGREIDYSSLAIWCQSTDSFSDLTPEGLFAATAVGIVDVSLTPESLIAIQTKNTQNAVASLFWSPVALPGLVPLTVTIHA
jgi:hypothetical protein